MRGFDNKVFRECVDRLDERKKTLFVETSLSWTVIEKLYTDTYGNVPKKLTRVLIVKAFNNLGINTTEDELFPREPSEVEQQK